MAHTILIVDDEGIVAEDLSSCVRGLGYFVAGVAARGEDAVILAGVHRPDVVLMDIMLQGEMDGIRAAQLIRDHFGTPVIFVTAYADESTLERAKITEPYGYILKPFEERELHSTIEIAIYKSTVERALKEKDHELEYRVLERTYELESTNEEMQAEIKERIRIGHELEESNMFLRSILDGSSSIAIVSVDNDGIITFWNIGAQKIFGHKAADVVGCSHISILFAHDEPWTIETLKQMESSIQKTKLPQRREVLAVTKSGEKIWINLAISPRLDERGNCIGRLGMGENITGRKLAERELFRARGRLEHLLDASRVIIYSRRVEAVYSMTFISNNSGTLLGCEASDVLDDPAFWTSRVHPDDRQRMLTTMGLFADGYQVLEYRFKHGNGTYRWLRDDARLVSDDNREPVEIVGSCVDITDEKKMEIALAESKALMDAVVENVPLMIFLKKATDQRFVIVNRAGEELLGYDRKDLLGKNDTDLFPPEQAADFMAKDRDVLDGEAGMLDIPEECVMTAKKGERVLHTRKVSIRGGDGTSQYVLGISEDITEHRLEQQRLCDSLEEKEVMLREIHHRVKNNLQVIIALVGLQAESVSDKQTQDMLAELQARARVMSLVHETLYQSQNIARVNLAAYIKSLSANVMETIGISANRSLKVHADDIFVGIDRAIPCGLIINELVTNALKYAFPASFLSSAEAPQACEIHIGIRSDGPSIVLSVSDNGIGLPEGYDWKRAKSLGLRLVNILSCNQLRGTIDVDTRRGTAFSITFCEPSAKKERLHHT